MITQNFKIGALANDFRYLFLNRLSEEATKCFWKSTEVEVKTNTEQNAFYFSHQIKHDTSQEIETVYRSIQHVIQSLRDDTWEFDIQVEKKGYSIEIYNIQRG